MAEHDQNAAQEQVGPQFAIQRIYTKDISFENMKTAIIVGSAMASFCVEKFGTTRMKEITKEDINARIGQFVDLVNFDIKLV